MKLSWFIKHIVPISFLLTLIFVFGLWLGDRKSRASQAELDKLQARISQIEENEKNAAATLCAQTEINRIFHDQIDDALTATGQGPKQHVPLPGAGCKK